MQVPKVENESVWKSVKILFIGSGLLFLINILFGFDNALVAGELVRGNLLIHLHSGSLGWITLSAIGLAIWLSTGSRQVDEGYERKIRWLVWASIIVVAGYIPNFWIAFSLGQTSLLPLLPIFGTATVILLWVATVYALSQFGKQQPLRTVHLLIAGALLVAAIGGTVGALLGLERVVGRFLPLPEVDRVGAHAGMMDSYLFLLVAAAIEWFTTDSKDDGWTYGGLAQTVAWVVGAAIVPLAFFTGAVQQLVPIFVMLMVVGLIIFLVRLGWKAALMGPTAKGGRAWIFFSTIWLVIYLVEFMYFASTAASGTTAPEWFLVIFAHSGYVGMVTNALLAVHAARGREAADRLTWAEPVSLWLINLGLLTFIIPRIVVGAKLGAIVMGIGVLLGVIMVQARLWASNGSTLDHAPSA